MLKALRSWNSLQAAVTKLHGLAKGLCRQNITWGKEDCSGLEFVNTIYNGTMESDPARRLVVDMHLQSPRDLTSQHHPEFLLALA